MQITSENSVDAGLLVVIPTRAEGRAEESGRGWALRQTRGQMPRLRCASLDMTNGAGLSRIDVQPNGAAPSTATCLSGTRGGEGRGKSLKKGLPSCKQVHKIQVLR